MNRRFFLQLSAFAAASSLIHWNFAEAAPPQTPGTYDAVVVGAGLGGLVCAAYLSRHGFRTALIEQYDIRSGGADKVVQNGTAVFKIGFFQLLCESVCLLLQVAVDHRGVHTRSGKRDQRKGHGAGTEQDERSYQKNTCG